MSLLTFLASKMPALFSSEYKELKNKVDFIISNKEQTLKSNKKLQKDLIADLERRVIIKESVKVLSEIYLNLKHGASVVSLSEFHGITQDLAFSKNQLEQIEIQIKERTEQAEVYSRELLVQNEGIKNASKALEKYGVLIKIL